MQFVALRAPPPPAALQRRGALNVRLARREARAGGRERLHLVLQLPRPAWGSLNITARGPVGLLAWSFTDALSQVPARAPSRAWGCPGRRRRSGGRRNS